MSTRTNSYIIQSDEESIDETTNLVVKEATSSLSPANLIKSGDYPPEFKARFYYMQLLISSSFDYILFKHVY